MEDRTGSRQPGRAGRGTRFFAPVDERIDLELVETRTFASRVVYARYWRVERW